MDFTLPESARVVRDGVAEVAGRYDHRYWSQCEDDHRFPWEAWNDLAEGGWVGLTIPEQYGGGGQGLLELAVACETLCASGATGGVFLYVLNPGFGAMTIARHGTEEQKKQILPGLADGSTHFALGLTEPDAGSCAEHLHHLPPGRRRLPGQRPEGVDLRAGARRLDDRGHQVRRRRGHEGEGHRRVTLLLVDVKEAVAAGTLTYTAIPKMGSNIVTSSQVFLDDVRVPADQVLGEAGDGVDYAKSRTVFGRLIGANQGIAFPLAQLKAKAELGRLMTYKAAWLFDQGLPCGNESNIAKLTGAQVGWEAADQMFQTFGGMAYSKEYPVERIFRDARIAKNIPVAEQLVLAHIGTQILGLPRTY